MFKCKELNKNFETKDAMFKELRRSYKDIIAFKKGEIHKRAEEGASVTAKPLDYLKLQSQTKAVAIDSEFYYIAVNATKILDSHMDVSIDGSWNKSVKEQQGKNYLVDTHVLSVLTTIARKEYIEMLTATIPFSAIGKKYDGDTEVLIYKIRKDKIINQVAKEWLESGDDIEASVRLQYMDIILAMDSDYKEDVKFKANYDKYIKVIANKEDFDTEITHFWVVLQQKNVLESSLVLFGSNSSTGLIDTKSDSNIVVCQECEHKFEYLSIVESGMGYVKCPECKSVVTQEMKSKPLNSTSKNNEPSEDTQAKEFYKNYLKN